MKLEIKNINGENTGRSVELPEDIFAITPNDHVIYMAVKAELSNKRLGTHSTLERSTVSGTTKKPWRQKGTGGARAGSVKTPLWPGGAITFGPHPHLYKQELNIKVRRLARKSALAYKAKGNKILVVEDFHAICSEGPKTKNVFEIINKLGLINTGKVAKEKIAESETPVKRSKRINKVLMLMDKSCIVKNDQDAKVYDQFKKSCRNIPGIKVGLVKNISAYDVMSADYLLFHESAMKNIHESFGVN
jgi:large subunit ribosomal protein L4